jgi:hypothetical protein
MTLNVNQPNCFTTPRDAKKEAWTTSINSRIVGIDWI